MRSKPARNSPSQSTSPSGSMFSSVPWSNVILGYVARSFSIRPAAPGSSPRSSAACTGWARSVIAKYAYPSPAARATISSRLARPSVRFVCVWRSPFSRRSVTTTGSSPASAASTSLDPRAGWVRRTACRGARTRAPRTRPASIARLRVEQPVLAELQPPANGHLPDPDVVRLGAGEVDHRRPPRLLRDDAEIDLEAEIGHDGGLGVPLARTRATEGWVTNASITGGASDPATRRSTSPIVSFIRRRNRRTRRVGRHGAEELEERLRDTERDVDLDAAAGARICSDPAGDVLLRLRPEPRQRGDSILFDRGHELVHGAHTEPGGAPWLSSGRARDRHQATDAGRDPLPEPRARRAHPSSRTPGSSRRSSARPRGPSGSRGVPAFQVDRIAADGPRGLLVGARLVRSSNRIDRAAYSMSIASMASFARGIASGYAEEAEQQRLLRVGSRLIPDHGPRPGPITSSVISRPRCAGRQWRTNTSGSARSTSF